MNIVFFGSSSSVIPIIEVLQKNFELKLVITTERPSSNLASQGQALRTPVISYCIKNKIPFISLKQFNNLTIQQLEKSSACVAILADFGLIIPARILSLFPKGIINIHPSLLPKYRGPTPAQTAILNGEKTTGVSIMKLDGEVDHGPILAQEKEKILDTDTSETLYKRLFIKGANLLPKVLNSYLKGNLKPIAQDHAKATFTKPLSRQSGFVEISKLETRLSPEGENSKLELERKIRAYFPWPGVWTRLRLDYGGQAKIIKFLPGNLIQVEGKRPVSYKDFLNGYPEAAKNLEFIIKD